jgi:hypothetical protein
MSEGAGGPGNHGNGEDSAVAARNSAVAAGLATPVTTVEPIPSSPAPHLGR